MKKHHHRLDRRRQRGLTLVEVLISGLIIAGLAGLIAVGAMNGFKLSQTQHAADLNHFNFTRLTEAFYKDVHESAVLASKEADGKRIVLESADGKTYITYAIEPKAVKRGESTAANLAPQQWEELTDSKMFAIASGSFAAYKADGTAPASLADVRRIDLKDLVATLNSTPQSKGLPVLTAYLRSLPVASPTPSAGGRYAILSGQSILFHGNSRVTSNPTGKGDVHANGDINRNGSSEIGGAVTYGGLSSTSGWHVPASPSHASTVRIPSYTPAQLQALLDAAKAIGTTEVEKASKDLASGGTLRGYYSAINKKEEIAFSGNAVLTIDGIVYIDGGLRTGGSFTLKGNGILVCTDRIVTAGDTRIQGSDSSSLALVSLASDDNAIDTQGSTLVTGILFAPNGGITINGNTVVNGCLIAGGPMNLASPTVHYVPGQSLAVLQATH